MSRIAYVNGRYLPHRFAMVHIEDRALQFADGIYEVCEVRAGRLVDERRHMARLRRSLHELRIAEPMSPAALSVVLHEVRARNFAGEENERRIDVGSETSAIPATGIVTFSGHILIHLTF